MVSGLGKFVLTVTARTFGNVDPQGLFAVTEMLPLTPAIAIMELVEELPDHPEGRFQV